MTPKQKAEELFDKFNNTIPIEALFSDTVEIANEKLIKDHYATKQCAIIALDDILKVLYKLSDCSDLVVEERNYYEEVKQELEKL